MRRSLTLLIILISLAALTCTKDETTSRPYPRVQTFDVTDITKDGALLNGSITYTPSEISDFGFIVSQESSPTFDNSEIVSLGTRSAAGTFSQQINWSLIPQIKYYVRGYAKNASYQVFGQIVSFVSLGSKAPLVTDLSPIVGLWYDTITVDGENFSSQIANVKAYFGSSQAQVLSASENKLRLMVPTDLTPGSYSVKVSISGNVSSKDGFALQARPSQISQISPDTVVVGDIVTLKGKNFSPNFTSFQINRIGVSSAAIVGTAATFSFPKGVANGNVIISGNTLNSQFDFPKNLVKPLHKISSLSTMQGSYDDIITIAGNYYPSDTSVLKVYFDDTPAKIKSVSRKEIQVQVPYFNTRINPTVAVVVEGVRVTLDGFLLLPHSIVSVTPTQHLMPGNKITITGKNFGVNVQVKLAGGILDNSYFTSRTNTQISFYLPDTTRKINSLSVMRLNQEADFGGNLTLILSYKEKTDPSGNFFNQSTNFVIGNKDYFGFGWFYNENTYTYFANNQFYEVDALGNSTQISTTIPPRACASSFTLNGIGYVGGGTDQTTTSFNDFYSFDPSNNTFTKLNNLPNASGSIDQVVSMFAIGTRAYCMTRSYILNKNLVYEYNPSSDQWTRRADFPGTPRRIVYGYFSNWDASPQTFSFNGIGYLAGGITDDISDISDLWSYDPTQDQWTQLNLGLSLPDGHAIFGGSGGIYLAVLDHFSGGTDFYQFSEAQNTFIKLTISLNPLPYFSNGGFGFGGQ